MSPIQFLLDTNIISDLIRDPQGRVAGKIKAVGESTICTSIIVACELRFGACKRGSDALIQRVNTILSVLPVVPFEILADQKYGEIRWHLEQAGTPIGPNGLLLAAQAKDLGLTVVTGNEREFRRVPGLAVENWLSL